jgi:dTMP kinase
MVDEYTWSRDMARVWIEKGGLIISNRYFTSNVHQIAKLEGKKRSLYRKWLWNSGYNHLKILKPDLVLFLDVLPKEAKNWIKNKTFRSYLTGSNQDLAEKSYRHQLAAYREYLYSVKTFKYWKRIGCYSKKDVLSPQEIHEKIWKEVCKVI